MLFQCILVAYIVTQLRAQTFLDDLDKAGKNFLLADVLHENNERQRSLTTINDAKDTESSSINKDFEFVDKEAKDALNEYNNIVSFLQKIKLVSSQNKRGTQIRIHHCKYSFFAKNIHICTFFISF